MKIYPIFFILSLIFFFSCAAVQYFCVADYAAPKGPTGYSCKDPAKVTSDDFVCSGLGAPGNNKDPENVELTPAFASQFAGLNGLGVSMARAYLPVGGVVPMHTHRRASEIVHVVEGIVTAGFIEGGFARQENKAYEKTLEEGDIMVFPRGLYHFEVNEGDTTAVVYSSFSSDDPGVQILENALFGNDLPTELVANTTFLDIDQIKKLKRLLGGAN